MGSETGGPAWRDEQSKSALRERLLAARRAMPPERVAAAASALRDSLLALPQLTMGGTIAVYHSVGTEPDTRKLIAALWKHGAYVLLPVLRPDHDLDWGAYEGPDSVAPAGRGLVEPTGPRYGVDAVARAAVVICPALAVDRVGTRLGRGAGSYDRALNRVSPHALTMAVIYDTELVERVPAEPHDRPVRAVATPEGGVHWF